MADRYVIENQGLRLLLRQVFHGPPVGINATAIRKKNPFPERLVNPCDDLQLVVRDAYGRIVGEQFFETAWYDQLFRLHDLSDPRCQATATVWLAPGTSLDEPLTFELYDGKAAPAVSEPLAVSQQLVLGSGGATSVLDPNVGIVDHVTAGIGNVGAGLLTGLEAASQTLRLGLTVAVVAGGAYLAWPLLAKARKSLD